MGAQPSDGAVIAVLELLDESGLELTASNIAMNTAYSKSYTRDICNWAAERGLLEKSGDGTRPGYLITDAGRDYLAGDLDASELPDPE